MRDEELEKKVEAAQRSLKRQKIWDGLTTAAIVVFLGCIIYLVVQGKVSHDINRIHHEVNYLVKPECLR